MATNTFADKIVDIKLAVGEEIYLAAPERNYGTHQALSEKTSWSWSGPIDITYKSYAAKAWCGVKVKATGVGQARVTCMAYFWNANVIEWNGLYETETVFWLITCEGNRPDPDPNLDSDPVTDPLDFTSGSLITRNINGVNMKFHIESSDNYSADGYYGHCYVYGGGDEYHPSIYSFMTNDHVSIPDIVPNTSGCHITKYGPQGKNGPYTTSPELNGLKVTKILPYSFSDCSLLHSVEISSTVKEIGRKAFNACWNINKVTVLSQIPPILEEDAFPSTTKTFATLYVPKGAKAAYEKESAGWKKYFCYIKEIGSDPTVTVPIKTSAYCSVYASTTHSLILKKDGTLWGCGQNSYGQLGNSNMTDHKELVKIADNVASASAGASYTMFVKKDGTLWACGYNKYGQLGCGDTSNKTEPVKVSDNVAQVAAAQRGSHTMILKQDGTVWACGYNQYCALGDGTRENRNKPIKVMEGVVNIAAGDEWSFFIKSDGTLWAAGDNNSSQLGLGDEYAGWQISHPVYVTDNVVQVSSCNMTTMVVKKDGSLFMCGLNRGLLGETEQWNYNSLTKVTEDVFTTSTGERHELFIKKDGTLWAGGSNRYGQIDEGTYWEDFRYSPIKIAEDVVSIAAGGEHTLYATVDGFVWGRGYNEHGETTNRYGRWDQPFTIISEPKEINCLPEDTTVYVGHKVQLKYEIKPADTKSTVRWFSENEGIASIDSLGIVEGVRPGLVFVYAVTANGLTAACAVTVKEVPAPEVTTLYSPIVQMTAGRVHTMIVTDDGILYGWGDNQNGQIGIKDAIRKEKPTKVMDNVAKVSTNYDHTLIVKKDGTLWACGENIYGQLGDDTEEYHFTPVMITENVMDAAAGYSHTIVLKKDGTVWTCGQNLSGQLGTGDKERKLSLIKVSDGVVSIGAGARTSYIIKKDGTLWGCGENTDGALADGTTENRSGFIKITDNVSSVAEKNGSQLLVIKKDGSLWSAGKNHKGQLGDGTTNDRNKLKQVATDVVTAQGNWYTSLVLKKNGTLLGCGSNQYGHLGDGTTNDATSLKTITDEVVNMALGMGHTLMVKADGSLWMCGNGSYGQLGDGTLANRYKPIKVIEAPAKNEHALKGDISGDSKVNGTDIVYLVDMILERSEKNASADVNGDGKVNGTDLVYLVDIILQRASARRMANDDTVTMLNASLEIEPFSISAGETREVLVNLTNPNTELTLLQFDISLPKGLSLGGSDNVEMGNRTNLQSHQLMTYTINDRTRFLLSSNKNETIEGMEGTVVRLAITADEDFNGGVVTLHNILGVTPNVQEVIMPTQTYRVGNDMTGISSISELPTDASAYSLLGQRQSVLKKGIYIINGKKVIKN